MFVCGEEIRAQLRIGFERDLAHKTPIVQEKFGRQDALLIGLLKEISSGFRRAPKRIFRMRLLPGGKLLVSFFRLQFVQKVKAGLEFPYVQGLNGSRPEGAWAVLT